MAPQFRLALIQLAVGTNKEKNVERAVAKVKEAASKGAQIVALPEMFNCPLDDGEYLEYAESIPGPSTNALANAARENGVFVIGGTIPETITFDKLYNTCTIFNPTGKMIGIYRKIHQYDLYIPDQVEFLESETFCAGNRLTYFDTPYCRIGIGICYDLRFPELAQLYAQKGCHLLVYPGAFEMTTGALHWEPLQISRALDNQLFVATVSQARDNKGPSRVWGHSMAVAPWGWLVSQADHVETIVYADIDLARMHDLREVIPVNQHRRHDLYHLVDNTVKD